MSQLKRLTVRRFKSIFELEDFELGSLNVLIGANGAGKSNFVLLFRMLAQLASGNLQLFVTEHDGPDALLFGTRKRSPDMDAEFYFGRNGYRITLRAAGDALVFSREQTWFAGDYAATPIITPLNRGNTEARLPTATGSISEHVRNALERWRVYHFHDTSASAAVRQSHPVRDNLVLKPDAANLAPFLRLLRLEHLESYTRIVSVIRLIAPFFGDFVHRDTVAERIDLEWHHAGDPDTPYGPRQLSDGTLRFIAIATLLLQPRSLRPSTVLLDEPELGLHPYAIAVLSDLFKEASEQTQLIVSTQSVELVNHLEPGQVVVVNRKDGASTFQRPSKDELKDWLEDYSFGELWKMNVIGGRPTS